MKRLCMLAALTAAACSACQAQQAKEYPKPEAMRPGMSEYWTPQPKVITPGDIKANTAPSDAIVLFDGKDLSAWMNPNGEDAAWTVKNGVMTVDKSKGDIVTRQKFGSFQLHLEWCVPKDIKGESQARGNSGVFLQDMYEVQILDCYGNETYVNGMTGSIYKQTPPLVNAMRKPGEWNVYDIRWNLSLPSIRHGHSERHCPAEPHRDTGHDGVHRLPPHREARRRPHKASVSWRPE